MDFFFLSFLGKWSYLGLFLVLFAAGLGLPLPEDIPLIAAGWLVHHGAADLWLMIATGLVGVIAGDTLIFSFGRRYGTRVVEHRWFRSIAKPWLLEKARRMYTDHGEKIIFAARFMPGLRSMMFLTAGTFRVSYWKFIIIDGMAALISVPFWIVISAKFSGHVEDLLGGYRKATYVMVSLFVAALVAWCLWEYFHNLRKRNRTAADGGGVGIAHAAPLIATDGRPANTLADQTAPDGAACTPPGKNGLATGSPHSRAASKCASDP